MPYPPKFFACCLLSALICDSACAQIAGADLTRQIDWVPQRASSANPDLQKNGDARPIQAGEELVLADLQGPGVINHIWTTIGTDDLFSGRNLVLKVFYDGAHRPSVQVPLGDFFGVGHAAAADYQSAITAVSSYGRARSCYWKMPFRSRIRVVVANEGEQKIDSFYYYLDWQQHQQLADDTVYFHARYRQERATSADDFVLLDTVGRGHYVGTVWSVQMAEQGWFGEGDDRFYVDGEEYPSLSGTGTEDYFGDAWGFRKFATPYFGVSLWDGYMPGDRCTAYRWHLADPIPFKQSLRVQMETRGSIYDGLTNFKGQFLPRQDFVSGVSFWYQWPIVEMEQDLPPARDRLAPYRLVETTDLKISAQPKAGLMKSRDGFTYLSRVADGSVQIEFTVPEDGTWQINPILNYGLVGGVYQPSLNGIDIGGPIDFAAQGGFDFLWTPLDVHPLKAGEPQTLKFTGVGKSPHRRVPMGELHAIGMSKMVMLRLEDLPGYRRALQEISKN